MNSIKLKRLLTLPLLIFACFSVHMPRVNADTVISVSVCQIMDTPTINLDNTGSNLVISGNSGEHTLVNETLYQDGVELARFDSDMQGKYSFATNLIIGTHQYKIVSIDGCGTTKSSGSVDLIQQSGFGGIIEIVKNKIFSQIKTISTTLNAASKIFTKLSNFFI